MKKLFVMMAILGMVACGSDLTNAGLDDQSISTEQAIKGGKKHIKDNPPPPEPTCPSEDQCYAEYEICNTRANVQCNSYPFPGCLEMMIESCQNDYDTCLACQ